jgi:hypothetical protein
MIDRDGDGLRTSGVCLYGPFDYDDTHGMVNSLCAATTAGSTLGTDSATVRRWRARDGDSIA